MTGPDGLDRAGVGRQRELLFQEISDATLNAQSALSRKTLGTDCGSFKSALPVSNRPESLATAPLEPRNAERHGTGHMQAGIPATNLCARSSHGQRLIV